MTDVPLPSPLGRGDRASGGRGNLFRPRLCSATFPRGEGLFPAAAFRLPSPSGEGGSPPGLTDEGQRVKFAGDS